MQRGMTLRAICKEIGISIQTSFDWRHKILGSLQTQVPNQLGPIVECDELELPLNNKEKRNLTDQQESAQEILSEIKQMEKSQPYKL